MYRANREELEESEAWRPPSHYTTDGQQERIARVLEDANAGRVAFYAVIDRRGAIVGTAGIESIERGHVQGGVLGYWVDRRCRRQGIASDAVRLILADAFGPLRLHRLQANVEVENIASQRVLERCGFERIGVARGLFSHGGPWRDHILYQRLSDDP
jgi:ribosomal-protein-alanine N-acetyltransferase